MRLDVTNSLTDGDSHPAVPGIGPLVSALLHTTIHTDARNPGPHVSARCLDRGGESGLMMKPSSHPLALKGLFADVFLHCLDVVLLELGKSTTASLSVPHTGQSELHLISIWPGAFAAMTPYKATGQTL